MCLSGHVHQARGELAGARDMYEILVASSLQRALVAQRPAPALFVHSDRGVQCESNAYNALLRNAMPGTTQAKLSHSRRG